MNDTAEQTLPILELEELISGPPEAVFDAWTDPEQLKLWFFGGESDHVRLAETDPRVGGKYLIVMSSDKKDWEDRGEYLEVERPNRLVFTWHTPSIDFQESLVTVTLTAEGEKTRLRLVHERLPADMLEAHRKGWTELFTKLENILA